MLRCKQGGEVQYNDNKDLQQMVRHRSYIPETHIRGQYGIK